MTTGAKIGIGVGSAAGIGGLVAFIFWRKKKKLEQQAALPEQEEIIPAFDYKVERIEKKPDLDKLVTDLGYKTENKEDPDDIPFENNDHLPKFQYLDARDPDWTGNDVISLHYFADDVLATDDKPPHSMTKDERMDIVGNFKEHLGEFEPDYIVVRNNERKQDYDITREPGTYRQYLLDNPTSKWSDDD